MSRIHWSISDYPEKSITTYIGSKAKTIHGDNPRFEEVYDLLKNNADEDEVIALIDDVLRVNNHCNGMFEVRDGVVYVGDEPVPMTLSKKIIKFADEGIDVKPLLSFWNHLSKNPSFHSRRQLFAFMEANKVPVVGEGEKRTFTFKGGIVDEVDCTGFIVSWKGVRDNLTDIHSGNFDNSPGRCIEMDRYGVNDDPTVACGSGLHVASWGYAKHFGGSRWVMVYVNPADVVSVPKDHDEQKMRTCRYYVVEEITNNLESIHDRESKLVMTSQAECDYLDDDDDDDDDYDDDEYYDYY